MESAIKILVTGETGFIGGRFVRDFAGTYEISTPNLRTIKIEDLDFSEVETVVHCAALVHQMKEVPDEKYFKINCDLTLRLAQAARSKGVKHFIFLSTAHVFGDSGSLDHSKSLTPDSPCNPQDSYGRSKLAAETQLWHLRSDNFRVSIIRPPMVYGEGAKGNLVRLAKLIRTVPILPFGYNLNKRSLIYVGNLVHFIHRAIESKQDGILLPQDERPLSIFQITELIANALNIKLYQVPMPHFLLKIVGSILPGLVTRLYGTLALNSSDSQKRIGYQPIYSTQEGFRRMLN